ncbi:MAG: zinc-dependent alcohol dehydrogenase family protein [Pyrinomonadaceae bacterium]
MKVMLTTGDGIERLRFEERTRPRPAAGQVLVRMTAASLNYRDLLVINGFGRWKTQTPRIPVSDGAGEVVELGDGVTRWKTGDRVVGNFLPHWYSGEPSDENTSGALGGSAADGVMSEFRIFDESALVRAPAELSDLEASTLPVAGVTAWQAVARRSRVKSGETVLIHGSGGVALFAAQFALALGATPIMTSSSDAKIARLRELGMAHAVNYETDNNWQDRVLELTSGRGVDHVMETVGGTNLNNSLQLVRVGGTVSFIGLIAGLSAPVDLYQFVMRSITLHGIETGSREMFEEMNLFISDKRLRPVVDRVFEWDEIGEALRYLESSDHLGKVVVRI